MNSDAVSRLVGSCKNILKMQYGARLLSQGAIKTVTNFSSRDMVTLLYVSSNSQIFNKLVAAM